MSQLQMRLDLLDEIPDLPPPESSLIRKILDGDEDDWCAVVNGQIGDWSASDFAPRMIGDPRFDSMVIFLLVVDGRAVATATAGHVTTDAPDIGYVHMVACLPDFQRRGFGRAVTLAVLHYLRDTGCRSAYLHTDDWRGAAIRTYWLLGFRPLIADNDHHGRWVAVQSALGLQ